MTNNISNHRTRDKLTYFILNGRNCFRPQPIIHLCILVIPEIEKYLIIELIDNFFPKLRISQKRGNIGNRRVLYVGERQQCSSEHILKPRSPRIVIELVKN